MLSELFNINFFFYSDKSFGLENYLLSYMYLENPANYKMWFGSLSENLCVEVSSVP